MSLELGDMKISLEILQGTLEQHARKQSGDTFPNSISHILVAAPPCVPMSYPGGSFLGFAMEAIKNCRGAGSRAKIGSTPRDLQKACLSRN